MPKLVEMPETQKQAKLKWEFSDHFLWYISPHMWTLVPGADGGAATMTDAAGGVLSMTAGTGTDNFDNYLKSTSEIFKFADDKPGAVSARLKYTEANVDDANVAFGVMDAVAQDAILDNGAGMKASFSGAVIYKVDGGLTWRCISSIGATRTDTASAKSSISANFQGLRIEWKPLTSAVCQVAFFGDNADGTGWELLKDANNRDIVHTLDMTSATEMNVFVGAKNGGANVETVLIDLVDGWAKL